MYGSLYALFSQWNAAGYVYVTFLIFTRIGGAISIMPGFGDPFIPMRTKLFLALALAVSLQPFLTPPIQDIPPLPFMVQDIISEFAIGILFGSWVRFIYFSLSISAGFFSQTLGITNIFDASMEPGGAPALSGFLNFTAITILCSTGGHFFIFEGLIKTYDLFPFRQGIDLDIASYSLVEAGSTAISLGLRLALPFLAIGFLVNIGLGFVNRAMPQIPVFFVGQPLMLAIGFMLLSLVISTMIFDWSKALQTFLLEHL